MQGKLLGIKLPQLSNSEVLEEIKRSLGSTRDFYHIVSLNPEIVVLLYGDKEFRKVVRKAQMKIIDGVGVVLAAQMLNIRIGARFNGVDLMENLLNIASNERLRVMLIGGGPKIAERVVECQKLQKSEAKFRAVEGISDIKNLDAKEEKELLSIVADYKPQLLLVAFGSPFQELWLYKHRKRLKGVVCMGAGGAFDFLSGSVKRAPRIVRRLGLEWLFRLILQPWRILRQIRLLKFTWLVVKERMRIR